MNCILLRRGAAPAAAISVTLSGNFHSSYGYVTINGTKYTSAETLEVDSGTEISVYVSAQTSSYQSKCYVTLNGETVKSGSGEYSFTPTGNTTITISYSGNFTSTRYYYAEITTS